MQESDDRHALSRRALLAGGAGVAGLVAGAGLIGRNQTASAASSTAGIHTDIATASDVFLQFIPGKPGPENPVGESRDKAFAQWIEVPSFSFEVENPTTIGSSTSGAGAGKAKFDRFVFTRPIDNASPQLFKAMVTGAHFQEAKLVLRKAGAGSSNPYLLFTFGTVFVSDIQWSGGNKGDTPQEQVTFLYGQLAVEYHIQNPNGTLGGANSAGWDQLKNGKWTPPTP